MPTARLPGPITGDLEGDIAILVLIGALMLILRVLDQKLGSTQRLGAFSFGVGLLSVSLALFIDTQRATIAPYANAPVDYARAAAGQSIYNQNCLNCHGMSGRGDGPGANPRYPPPDLAVHIFQHDEAYFVEVIANGRGTMPGFKDRLLQAQMGDVINYLRVLGKKNQ